MADGGLLGKAINQKSDDGSSDSLVVHHLSSKTPLTCHDK